MTNLHVYIETVPAQDEGARADLAAQHEQRLEDWGRRLSDALANVSAPSNWKDPDKIAAYVDEQRRKLTAQAEQERDNLTEQADRQYRNTARDGARGQICVISWAVNDGPVQHVKQDPTGQATEPGEAAMLQAFFDFVAEQCREAPRWVGFDILGFDLRFIFQRCVVLGVRPLVALQQSAPPHASLVFDTMLEWSGYRGRASELALCNALGLDSDGVVDVRGTDRSQVWDYVAAGNLDAVADYCDGMVERSRQVFQRLTFSGVDHD